MIDPGNFGQLTLTVKDVQGILRIGQVSAYSLVRSNVFPVVRIGKSYRIPKDTFVSWMQTAYPTAKANDIAIADDTCILSKLKNGGIYYGK